MRILSLNVYFTTKYAFLLRPAACWRRICPRRPRFCPVGRVVVRYRGIVPYCPRVGVWGYMARIWWYGVFVLLPAACCVFVHYVHTYARVCFTRAGAGPVWRDQRRGGSCRPIRPVRPIRPGAGRNRRNRENARAPRSAQSPHLIKPVLWGST